MGVKDIVYPSLEHCSYLGHTELGALSTGHLFAGRTFESGAYFSLIQYGENVVYYYACSMLCPCGNVSFGVTKQGTLYKHFPWK